MSQDLRRTPTSTGNQKVFTYSCWIKRNGLSAWARLLSIMNGNTDAIIQLTNVDKLRFRDEVTSPDIDYISSRPLRDAGSWMHLLVAIDTTHIQAEHRIRMYVNGDSLIEHGLDTESMPGDRNLDLQFNDKLEHRFFARNNDTEYFLGEAFDLFWVDGQALTPDVFGFNKDGDGYVSVGSTQATDFRPGQWVPKSPRTIKSEINRRGGFGVNGFYLPMNDSSNFGADFHMTPDTIIKLKGEDLPQPRNGLPTTSDNYVSQLRSDPYAANLVLAVPGVNTQPTGSELITNGTFDTNVSGWTVTDTGTIVRQSDGTAKVTRGSSAEVVYQDITTVVGTTYELSVDITDIGGSHGQVYVKSTPHSGSINTSIGYSFYTGTYKGTFTADTTTTRIILYAHPSGFTSYDNISVKATTIRDYHADIKGSGTNKTLTGYGDAGVRNPNGASGFSVNGYYGSALQFDGSGDYLQTPDSADFTVGTGDYTIEGWFYFNNLSATRRLCGQRASNASEFQFLLETDSNGILAYYYSIGNSSKSVPGIALSTSQWTHIAVERYNTIHTLYVNGVTVGTNSSSGSLDDRAQPFSIGRQGNYTSDTFNGYIQDFRFYKGVAKYKGGFDVPKPYNPTRSLETWRQVPDTCKNNFATFNPAFGVGRQDQLTYSNGNLRVVSGATSGSDTTAVSTMAIKGKIYCEFSLADDGLGAYVGIMKYNTALTNNGVDTTAKSDCWLIRGDNEHKANGDGGGGASYGSGTFSTGDIIMLAVDIDNTSIWFGKNGTWYASGNPATNSNAAYTNLPSTEDLLVMCGDNYSSETPTIDVNFGQNPTFGGTKTAGTYTDSNGKGLFKYQPPTGFLAMCKDNLPTPAIADPGEHFKTVLWTGDGNTGRSITGVGFKPDLVWIKERGGTSNHNVYDSVRGVTKRLYSDLVNTEYTYTNNNPLNSFDSDGFSIGADGALNQDGIPTVAWCWKAGGAAVTNTDGTITSQVSANQTAGFSIVSYTGTGSAGTVGHGLGKAPSLIITKHRAGTSAGNVNWNVSTSAIPGGYLELNTNAMHNSNADRYVTAGTNTNSFPGGYVQFNDSNRTYISYCWAEIDGYSKIGSYTGNQNADGPFVYCGFKPAFLLLKITSPSGQERDWHIYDNTRNSINPLGYNLRPSANTADTYEAGIDFLSNGFKLRHGYIFSNYNGGQIFFAAFAESPFQTANAK